MPAPYCSLADVQRETGNSDSALESWFEDCANTASRWVEEYCHRDFLPHNYVNAFYTVPHSCIAGESIFLDWPIITLAQVVTNQATIDPALYLYQVGGRTIELRDGSHWDNSTAVAGRSTLGLSYGSMEAVSLIGLNIPVTIKGTFGYVTPPPAIRMACTRIAAAWTNEKRRERVNRDGQRVSILDSSIADDTLSLLKRYRRLVN